MTEVLGRTKTISWVNHLSSNEIPFLGLEFAFKFFPLFFFLFSFFSFFFLFFIFFSFFSFSFFHFFFFSSFSFSPSPGY